MRILVVSDTHRNKDILMQTVEKQPSAEMVLHLGDGADDVEYVRPLFTQKVFAGVKGNCDLLCSLPEQRVITVEGKRILMLHGHTKGVKFGLINIRLLAQQEKADILLFGHTHTPITDFYNGIFIMNPGSLGTGYYPTYGIIDITPAGIKTSIIQADL